MGLLDKLRQLGRREPRQPAKDRSSQDRRSKRSAGGYESLPGGASGQEAAEANPQRAGELAD